MQRSTWEQWRGSVDRWEIEQEEAERRREQEAQRIQYEEDLKAEKARELAEVYQAQERSRLAGRTILPRFLQYRILQDSFMLQDKIHERLIFRSAQRVSYLWLEAVNLMISQLGGYGMAMQMPRRPLFPTFVPPHLPMPPPKRLRPSDSD